MTHERSEQLTTFRVGAELFGIEVLKVQEVTGNMSVVPIPLAPVYVRGLINLRGQIATALGLRELFGQESATHETQMSVVCKIDGNLVSLIVDSIGDVIEVERESFEKIRGAVAEDHKKYVKGVYKLRDRLLSVLDLDVLAKELSPPTEAA